MNHTSPTTQTPLALPSNSSNALHNLDCEQAVLGTILVDNSYLAELSDILTAEMFYVPLHQRIFEVISLMIGRGDAVHPLTLRGYFKDDLVAAGNDSYLARLGASVCIDPRVMAEAVRDLWLRRSAIEQFTTCAENLMGESDDTAQEIIGGACNLLDELIANNTAAVLTRKQVLREIMDDMKHDLPCHSTGINALDKAMDGGIYQSRMYGFTARKKQGKTMLVSTLTYNLEKNGVKHLLITAEMSPKEIEQRRIARQIGVNEGVFRHSDFRSNPRRGEQIAQVSETCENLMLYRKGVMITFDQLKREVSACVRKYKISGFVLDYLQRVTGKPKGQNYAEFMDDVANWIAAFCRDANIWAVVIAQMNQTGSVRGGEGILLACDQAYELKRHEGDGGGAWLDMLESRYAPYMDVGDERNAGIILDTAVGPHFREP